MDVVTDSFTKTILLGTMCFNRQAIPISLIMTTYAVILGEYNGIQVIRCLGLGLVSQLRLGHIRQNPSTVIGIAVEVVVAAEVVVEVFSGVGMLLKLLLLF